MSNPIPSFEPDHELKLAENIGIDSVTRALQSIWRTWKVLNRFSGTDSRKCRISLHIQSQGIYLTYFIIKIAFIVLYILKKQVSI